MGNKDALEELAKVYRHADRQTLARGIDLLFERVAELESAILQANVDYDNACLDRPCVPLERLAGMLSGQRGEDS